MQKILVACDGSASSFKACDMALELARRFPGCQLVVLNVAPLSVLDLATYRIPMSGQDLLPAQLEERLTRVSENILAAALERLTGVPPIGGAAGGVTRGRVWTDSPQGNYANREDSSLTTKPFVVEGKGAQLSFDARHRLEPMGDYARVEIKPEGSDWKKLAEYTSYSEWKSEVVDLSAYENQRVQLRFRLTSDSARNDEGVYLDRICVAGPKSPREAGSGAEWVDNHHSASASVAPATHWCPPPGWAR